MSKSPGVFRADFPCTALETASKTKEGGRSISILYTPVQHPLHTHPTAQLSVAAEAEAKRPTEAEKNSSTPDIKGTASFHLLRG